MNLEIGKYSVKIYISKLEKRTGICSQVYEVEDKHILLWDFDNSELSQIIHDLENLQLVYRLPRILIIESSPNKYHAYCFVARSFREIINILSATPEIDMSYLRLGIVRGYFTLRISNRPRGNFSLIKTLPSIWANEVSHNDITINEYMTSNRGQHNAKRT